MLIWPDNKTWIVISKEILKQQLELINLADVYELYSNELFKKQKIWFKFLFFKITTINKLFKSKSS